MKKLLILPLMAGLSLPSLALQPIGDAGINGFVNLGGSAGEIETNFLAQIDGINIDLGDPRLDSFDSPDSESLTMGVVNFDVGYTLSSGKTRFSLGNDFTDFIEFDRTMRLAVRHDFDSIGSMKLAGLAPSSLATKVYSDPYQTNVKRGTTDMEVSGVRFTWDKILGSNFEVVLSAKEVDVEDEDSGQALGLSKADQDLLDRNGDVLGLEVGYKFTLNDNNTLRPSIKYIDRDLDGDAMSQDGAVIDLTHVYKSDSLVWANKLSYADMSGDKDNPIFGDANDADVYGIASVMSFPDSIGFLGKWTPNIAVSWADSDSDIDFNDSNIWMVSAALSRRF
jgi:Protein of unknown function (DUF2860)